MTLVDPAIAFVLNHSSVTSALIGPRTLQHLETQLPAADVTFEAGVLEPVISVTLRSPPSSSSRADLSAP
ncbi:hypothetical protein [Streptomyces sp. Go-475]|uniref:hypothetical protein n=1 Tax=Streptomyces sp. Go-475 TaxID=2072505 RepID=UPI000DEF62A7|nr:hypothetical protein [Streptomyces sp. Go-475]